MCCIHSGLSEIVRAEAGLSDFMKVSVAYPVVGPALPARCLTMHASIQQLSVPLRETCAAPF